MAVLSIVKKKANLILIILLLVYCLYTFFFIWRTSFIVHGERYFTLQDDAMISMRYARNLVEGHGLVFNPAGDRVEGFSNPLWVLYMALVHLLPVAKSKISIFIQASGAILGLINVLLVKRLADLLFDESTMVSLGAVALTAFYLPLNNWNLQGMEVSALTVIMTAAAILALQCVREKKSPVVLFALLGGSTLLRIDMLIPSLVILGFLLKLQPERRRYNLMLGVLFLGLTIGLQTLGRIWYYGDALPNTYYLKMTGYPLDLRIARGFSVFLQFVAHMYWIPLFMPFSILFFRRDRGIVLLILLFTMQVVYSIYVGGDAWEWWGGSNRFISIGMPMFFILYSYSIREFGYSVARKLAKSGSSVSHSAKLTVVGLLVISLIVFNSISGPTALSKWLLIDRPLHVVDNINMVERAELVTEITTPQASIAVTWAGAIPYFSNRHTIDLLGKTDRRIAREEVRVTSSKEYTDFLPGHMKRDYAYSLGVLKPDVIVQLWKSASEAADQIYPYYQVVRFGKFIFGLRRDSQAIRWDKVQEILKASDTQSVE